MLFMSSNESGIGGGWYVLAAAVEPYIAGVQVASHQCHVNSDAIVLLTAQLVYTWQA